MDFLLRTRGRNFLSAGDLLSYMYLTLGVFIMFVPVLWGVISSFKTPAAISRFPPEALPYANETIEVEGYDRPLPLYEVTNEDGSVSQLAQIRSIGIEAQLIDPANPEEVIKVPIAETNPLRSFQLEFNNYVEPLERFEFLTFFKNSVIVTVSATILTLIFNSMAAFALSKYQFPGRDVMFGSIIATLMIPSSVVLVPLCF